MARIVNFLKIIKNNWKKSLFGATVVSYGVSYSIDAYNIQQIMVKNCQEAVVYGDQPLLPHSKPENVLVILNPVAKKKKAKKLFEKYCEPLLHLAGFAVTIVQTQSENEARSLIANLNTPTDIIVVAGGDGTLSDVVTGIMRRYKDNSTMASGVPIGILPLGSTNTVANSLFHGYEDLKEVRELVDATMAIVRGKTKLADVIKVQLLEENEEKHEQSIYALGSIEWSAWKDAHSKMDKYWYLGSLRRYASYIFGGLKSDLSWDCTGIVKYSDPCSGCSKCYNENTHDSSSKNRWWNVFVPKTKIFSQDQVKADYSKVKNDDCGIVHEIPVSTTELSISTKNIEKINDNSVPSVNVALGPQNVNYTDFVAEGLQRIKGNKTLIDKTIKAKNLEVYPENTDHADKERFFYIDNEEFELKPVKLKLLPSTIKLFCPENQVEN